MENSESEINRIALELEYSELVEPEIISWIIEAHEVVIADVTEELGRPDLQAQFANKFFGFSAIMGAMITLEKKFPNISPYIAKRVREQLDLEEPT